MQRYFRPGAPSSASKGYSLVEFMIAITIGLIILAGLITIFVRNNRTRDDIERANQQNDNGLYAIQTLADDLRNAGYLGEMNVKLLATPAAKPDACATDLATLQAALPLGVQGYDNSANAPTCLSDVRSGTDILVVRRVSTCAVGETGCDAAVAGAPYFQASACSNASELSATTVASYYALDTNAANLTRHARDCATLAPIRQFRTHIYFIANNDKSGDGIPTLKRAELGANGFTVYPVAEGVESMQLEWGLDSGTVANQPTTGTPGVYTADPDTYNGCSGQTCVGYWRNAVAARVSLLVRTRTPAPGYSDGKTYTLGYKADGSDNTFTPSAGDGYKRRVYSSTVRLNNAAGRNAS
ncbi:type IV pilus assembly protein PilW [Noviherbaspirillum humi]|uniref:Type IV pilus assembly protein PilW n=1 Tax=Noviherbaspirillum humi TaxID=1688639 RepID=A0A239DLM6_9BURK|nr:PilW family protein [Noviherbaspirillum humi]SNS32961.1 type IV pilus assembly protein PilW [Noviherbaspirillum humi]